MEQMVERQQATLRALMSTHTEKLARLKQQDRLYVPICSDTCPNRKYLVCCIIAEVHTHFETLILFSHEPGVQGFDARISCTMRFCPRKP